MNRREFAKSFAERYGLTQEDARELCYSVFENLKFELDKGENVYIYGFGTFKHEIRKAKNVRHPKTGEMMTIPERQIITFKVSNTSEENNEEE